MFQFRIDRPTIDLEQFFIGVASDRQSKVTLARQYFMVQANGVLTFM